MGKEDKVGISTGSLEQRESSLDQLLSQEEHQDDFASYLAKVNKERAKMSWLNQFTGDEIGVKLAFAFKANQLNLYRLAFNYLATRGNLLNQGMDPKELILDLAACDLSGVDLSGADLSEVKFLGANLSRANLSKADLLMTDFLGADLREANLSRARLGWADITEANLIRANLSGVDLREIRHLDHVSNASGANFTGTQLDQTKLQDLNRLDKRQGSLLQDAHGLVRDESGRIIGVKSLLGPEPETPEIEEAQDIRNILVNFLLTFTALSTEKQETFLNELRKSQNTTNQ